MVYYSTLLRRNDGQVMGKLAASIIAKHPNAMPDEQGNVRCTGCGKIIQRTGPEWEYAGPLQFYVAHCIDEAIKENRKLESDLRDMKMTPFQRLVKENMDKAIEAAFHEERRQQRRRVEWRNSIGGEFDRGSIVFN